VPSSCVKIDYTISIAFTNYNMWAFNVKFWILVFEGLVLCYASSHKEACSEYGRAILHIALVEFTLLEDFTNIWI
jgi:hypothetical protein